ncbi:MAG: GNAT family N-acetyltransferase [Betaproteobacteria bacterium]
MSVAIAPLVASDYAEWLPLARAYKAFYETVLYDEEYTRTWQRLMAGDAVSGLGARVDGRLVGIVHAVYHASAWAEQVCYLQDLFVDPAVRGRGVARALIEAVAANARRVGAARLYWTTQQHNATARTLYDKLASFNGFIRYDYPV